MIRVAYRLDSSDIEHLLLGGDVIVTGDGVSLVLSVNGVPVRDVGSLKCSPPMKDCGARIGCVRSNSFDSEDDGT
jgi:hypothetical protein